MAETLPSNRSVQTGANPSTQPESTVSAPGGLLGHAAATLGTAAVQRKLNARLALRSARGGAVQRLVDPKTTPEFSADRDPQAVKANSPDSNAALPYTKDGWNAQEILSKLGQFDTLDQTGSDAARCVQAVGLASHILTGPAAVVDYISSSSLMGMLKGKTVTADMKTQLSRLEIYSARVTNRMATYSDLSKIQESLHLLFYGAKQGTPSQDIHDQVVPPLDFSAGMEKMSVWVTTPAELSQHATALGEGQQLLVTQWTVVFNNTFDKIDGDKINASGSGGQVDQTMVTFTDEKGKPTRTAFIKRIDTTKKPPAGQINIDRDSKSGHQMLIYKKGGQVFLYEPELTNSGKHLGEVKQGQSDLISLIKDFPAGQIYQYIEIAGKITTHQMPKGFGES